MHVELHLSFAVAQDNFHPYFLGLQTAFFVEFHRALIAAPYIQRHIITPLFSREIKDGLIDRLTDMHAAFCLVHTEIIDVQSLDVSQYIII